MRTLTLAILLLLALGAPPAAQAPPGGPSPPPPPSGTGAAAGPALTPLEALQAENLKLKAQILELQRALAQSQLDQGTAVLAAERARLETAFRVTLQAAPGAVFDWQTLTFRAPEAAAPPGGPPGKP